MPKVINMNLVYFSRCGRFGVYAEYGAQVISAPYGFYRNGFLLVIKNYYLFNFFEMLNLYYNIMSIYKALIFSELYFVFKEIMIKILLLFYLFFNPFIWEWFSFGLKEEL